jgi:hypothetical protein
MGRAISARVRLFIESMNKFTSFPLVSLFVYLLKMPVGGAPGTIPGSSTLHGKVMVGYQGWFNCEGDGANLGWTHWTRHSKKDFGPGNVTVDLWPDMSGYAAEERYPTGFRHADGSPAEVFSSANRATVLTHFKWMQEYGIDGAFLQRFANGLTSTVLRGHKDTVLSHFREGSRVSSRVYAVMYDLSGLNESQVSWVKDDWEMLSGKLKITQDAGYLHHRGKPLVAVWGVGFNDNRKYSLLECYDLVKWLESSGYSVMLGVPTYWREMKRDSINDPMLHQMIRECDVLSPWTIGRYNSPQNAARHAQNVMKPDIQWAREHGIDYLPVLFPGFSWRNMRGGDAKLGQIPRLKGEFYWSQFKAAKESGAQMAYVAMFDEVDEATAIFKCTNNPPVGDGVEFLTYEGLPSDHYLRLTGEGGKLLRGE